ncbi:MAG TPA: aspartate aminotransferase family protein, partial [Spirochaetota bacterium]|nr:aspartate aminotransferase family protein [Spirochaetota bacterium]
QYLSANGLNPMAFKSLKQLESEVVRMTANLLHGGRDTAGVMTSGGTESCLLAVKTYRDMGRVEKRIRRPEMVIPETAHVAWEKGAEYFGVKAVRAPLRGDFGVDVGAVRKLVNRNTVMILGSAPEYPHGIIDPIQELGAVAYDRNIPLHVDACLGGYLLPFIEKLGVALPAWDFRVPGVTSVSADAHKYAFSAKGASVILYRSADILKHQFFVFENWPGGVFASPALLGTRPGGAYAAAWASIMALGEDGFLKNTREILKASNKLKEGIRAIPELDIIGTPLTAIFAYTSKSKNVNIYAVADVMEKRGWHIDRLQRPDALHAMLTPLHLKVIPLYLKDLRESVEHVKLHPELASKGGAAMYGMISHIPLRGMVKKTVLKMFADMYGPDAKMIEPEGMSLEGEGPAEQPDLATRAAMWYLKMRERFRK